MNQSPKSRRFIGWFFNGTMIWGAILGAMIAISLGDLIDTARHKGAGVVHYGDGERSPEWSEEVSEMRYKRHNYVTNGFLLGLSLTLWFWVAKAEQKQRLGK